MTTKPAITPATTDPAYVIGPEDVLDINVWKEPDVTRVVPVRPDGRISLPLINDVQAAGSSPQQLAAAVTEKLRKYPDRAAGHRDRHGRSTASACSWWAKCFAPERFR